MLHDSLDRLNIGWKAGDLAEVFALMATELAPLNRLTLETIPEDGVVLDRSSARSMTGEEE